MSLAPGYAIQPAHSQQDLQAFARLVLEYSQWLGVDLGFQAFEKELASLPGCYASPDGCILLLQYQPDPSTAAVAVGCVAVRPLHTNHSAQASASRSPTPVPSASPQDVPTQHCTQEETHLQAHTEQQRQQHQQQSVPFQQAQQHNNVQDQLGPSSMSSSQQAVRGAADEVDTAAGISSMCEMKRLWVTQQHKGKGLGTALAVAAVAAAQELGYSHMVLDTLDTLTAANRLYEGLGFQRRSAYYHNPLPGVVYWHLELK